MHNHWLLLYGCFENLKTLLLRSLGMLEYRQVWTQGITFLASFEYYIIITCWDEGFSNAAPTSIQKRFSPAFAYCFPAKQSNIFLPPPRKKYAHVEIKFFSLLYWITLFSSRIQKLSKNNFPISYSIPMLWLSVFSERRRGKIDGSKK